jgi:hypothetical protein
VSIGITFGGPDEASIRLLEGWPNGLFYRPDVCGDHTAELIEKHFTNGSSVFHDGDPFERYFVARVRNYAHVETMAQTEIRNARVVGDCHDGKIIKVSDASSWVKWFRTLTPEEYGLRVFGKDYGFPPFSIECSCRMAGIVPGVEEGG